MSRVYNNSLYKLSTLHNLEYCVEIQSQPGILLCNIENMSLVEYFHSLSVLRMSELGGGHGGKVTGHPMATGPNRTRAPTTPG
jgi:hypothetical protein